MRSPHHRQGGQRLQNRRPRAAREDAAGEFDAKTQNRAAGEKSGW